tara:strand:+ start:769 stop:1464 length:696 start_codon:yes stop_codon:yes gene_type:complete
MEIPSLRRRKKRVNVSGIAGNFIDGVASINATVEPRAEFWDNWNRENIKATGPLWVALGDSVTQGIGSSNPSTSYAALILSRLKNRTGKAWRLINLSMSGARLKDVTDLQLKVMRALDLQPNLVTAIIGSNDIMWRRNTRGITADAKLLIRSLPEGSYLSKVSRSKQQRRRKAISLAFETIAPENHIHLFNAWNWPTAEGMFAEDKFHPNDYAYEYIADNLWHSLYVNDFI